MSPTEPHRLGQLLGLTVQDDTGRTLGHVNDLRLSGSAGAPLAVEGLIVADRHAGSLLGYDRDAEQGPWLVRVLVRLLHRHAGYLPWSAVQRVEWGDAGRVVVRAGSAQPLSRV